MFIVLHVVDIPDFHSMRVAVFYYLHRSINMVIMDNTELSKNVTLESTEGRGTLVENEIDS